MNFKLLDNPGWYALNSYHRHLAIRGDITARYQPDILMGAAMPEYNQAGFNDLKSIVEPDEVVGLICESLPEDLSGWEVLMANPLPQLVCEELKSNARVDAVELTMDDVPEMLELIALAQPGPFLSRTIEVGRYIGVRQDGRLVAMGGERLHLPGFCEISAVCSHPDYRGRGYGGALTAMAARSIMARNEIPFLHHEATNHAASRLYNRLGFKKRKELSVVILKKTTSD